MKAKYATNVLLYNSWEKGYRFSCFRKLTDIIIDLQESGLILAQKFTQSQENASKIYAESKKKDTIPKGLVSQMLKNNLEFLLDSKGDPEAHLPLNGSEGGIIYVGLHMLGNHGINGETGVAGSRIKRAVLLQ